MVLSAEVKQYRKERGTRELRSRRVAGLAGFYSEGGEDESCCKEHLLLPELPSG
jgi:hypothetical protein